jgi:hypothetical protein
MNRVFFLLNAAFAMTILGLILGVYSTQTVETFQILQLFSIYHKCTGYT